MQIRRSLLAAGLVLASAGATAVQAGTTRAAHAASPLRDQIVAVATAEAANGSHNAENPMGSNCNYFSGQMGTGSAGCGPSGWRSVAWCADFSEYVWRTAGVTDRAGIDSWAYSFWRYGLAKGTWHAARTGYTPQPGDAVVFDWDGSFNSGNWQDIDHVGIVKSSSGGTVYTVEGNASDRVQHRSYGVNAAVIVGYTSPVGAGDGGGGGSYSDGTLLREPNGTIAVIAGGAAYYFYSMDELNAAGYGGKPYVSVAQGFIGTLPAQPVDGTLVRKPADGGSIAVVAGGTKFFFHTMDELNAAGYGGRPFVNLPARSFDAIPTTPGNGVLIRRPDGSIAVTAGGAKFSFSSMDELNAAGYAGTPFTNIGTSAWNAVTTVAKDGTLIRRSDGSIAVVAGGAKFAFTSMDELNAAGYGTTPFVNVGWNAWNAVTGTAQDGTLVRAEGEDGVWRVTAGKRALTTEPVSEAVTILPLGAFRAIPQA